ncbi:methylenetetrahydrofolate reductase [NAD(P)H] [Candidatus Igneacidithiobacillus taiwanensis]|uniref:methylenetetrahydrofolate reductase [NAD(P)H] n=1 Tax=Candidatus Igneacidithiobacillus taiwanensis TaxID=1945924 RepID=UPI00289C7EC1|nr:methylenetetrahydrofolate reductase [NAD(P)H] [Candidatus Igneacidithiobacillus taiwanensis]MCE5360077.1 methylenetetrahydrofolate reductase [NAD(P)H] [Acidithiobacillus sp.]
MAAPEISVEFFPPKNAAGEERLRESVAALAALRPAYASVTYGAGGSTQERTLATVRFLQEQGDYEAVPHLTCIGSTESGIRELLQRYRDWGIRRIVALRGDLPDGMENPGFFRHASDLVAFIRAFGGFEILASAYPDVHPQAISAKHDLDYLVAKVKAGVDTLVTQYFYNPDAYLQLRDALARRGVQVPIVVGIMPIQNYQQIVRFSAQCGAEIPRYMQLLFEAYADDPASQNALATEIVARQCALLLREGAPGLHFYTLNQAEPTLAIAQCLGI